MTWVRVDDSMPEHPKCEFLEALGPDRWSKAMAVWLAGGCYCSRNLTDGTLSAHRLHRLTPLGRAAERAANDLVDAGLWESDGSGGYLIHDYLAYNPSKEEVEQTRADAAERKRRSRGLSQRESQGPSQRDNRARSHVSHGGSTGTPLTAPDGTSPIEEAAQTSGPSASVALVWSRYVEQRARVLGSASEPKLDRKRRSQISARLKDGFTVKQLCEAVDALWSSEWHVRERQTHPELVFRSTEQVEKLLARSVGAQAALPIADPPQPSADLGGGHPECRALIAKRMAEAEEAKRAS